MGKLFWPVHGEDYQSLVFELGKQSTNQGRLRILQAVVDTLPDPQWENEIRYFYIALYNAGRANLAVLQWLCTLPTVLQNIPERFHILIESGTIGYLPRLKKPLIGVAGDKLVTEGTGSTEDEEEQSLWIN